MSRDFPGCLEKGVVFLLEAVQTFLQMSLPLSLRLSDLLDIAILSFVIYKILWILRKTSSGRVLWGILILLFAMALVFPDGADCYQLPAGKAGGMGRRGPCGSVPAGDPPLFGAGGQQPVGLVFSSNKSSPMDLEFAIAQTTAAYTDMSRDKVGALMVFERQNLLDDVIKTGTALDCAVSSELLKNIFWNKAPLHDGAVIVRDGRIVGAGCMLPLSGNVNLSRDLGMRHRAGIGMSEHSDAVVVIVSEETGSISAAVGGMLKRHLAPETLERLLRNELLNDDKQEEKKGTQIPLLNQILGWSRKEGDPVMMNRLRESRWAYILLSHSSCLCVLVLCAGRAGPVAADLVPGRGGRNRQRQCADPPRAYCVRAVSGHRGSLY